MSKPVHHPAELCPVADPEVRDRPRRRSFSAEYKLSILRQADACTEPGQVGALLRREGLYSSQLSEWRKKRVAGELQGLAPRKRGRNDGAVPRDPAHVTPGASGWQRGCRRRPPRSAGRPGIGRRARAYDSHMGKTRMGTIWKEHTDLLPPADAVLL